jgi:cysteine desulfurase
VYLDNNSTTRVDPRVFEAMAPYLLEEYGNPASTTHEMGRRAKEAVEVARQKIASLIHATPEEIVFTSGATESNNLAIRGVCTHRSAKTRRIVTSLLEHRAVLDPIRRLEKESFEVSRLKGFDRKGAVDAEELSGAIAPSCDLLSLMLANNEIGTIGDFNLIAELKSRSKFVFHCDAAQALGKIAIDVRQSPVDLMSFSGHKLHGPKGVGALYVRRGTRLKPVIDGGGHEGGKRSGTLNVGGIVGFGTAAGIVAAELSEIRTHLQRLTTECWRKLTRKIEGVYLNGPPIDERLPGNLNITIDGVDAETLTLKIPRICISTGSACTSADPEPSHVLQAIGLSEMAARASIRIGLSRFTTDEEVDFAVQAIADAVFELRQLNREL